MGTVVDGKYEVTEEVTNVWTLTDIQDAIDTCQERIDEYTEKQKEYETIKSEMVAAGITE